MFNKISNLTGVYKQFRVEFVIDIITDLTLMIMTRLNLIVFLLIGCVLNLYSQDRYHTNKGYARFFSEAPLENIEAFTNEVRAVLDFSNGELLCIVPVGSFTFDKSLMQRHFNEQYLETHKYPEARFRGRIDNFNPILIYYEEPRNVRVIGELTIHGVTNQVSEMASLQLINGLLTGKTVFMVSLDEYDIRVPRLLVRNIAEEVEVTIELKLEGP